MTMTICDAVVDANIRILEQCKEVLREIPPEVYRNRSVPPYGFSIGAQTRHNLDMYESLLRGLGTESLLRGLGTGVVDLTERERNPVYENDPQEARRYATQIQQRLGTLSQSDQKTPVVLVIEPSIGKKERVETTLGGGLATLFLHTMHHHAVIAIMASAVGYRIPDPSFGYNPSTLRFLGGRA